MKKIIAFALLLVLALSLVACGPADTDDLTPYNEAIANTSPASVVINTSFHHTELDIDIEGEYTVTFGEDGTATVNYWYYKLNEASLDNELLELVDNQVAYIANDGTVTGDLEGTVTAAVQCKMNLDPTKMQYSIDRGILTATVKADDTKAVLGTDLGFDATLHMGLLDDKISSYSISYTTHEGSAAIVCKYTN